MCQFMIRPINIVWPKVSCNWISDQQGHSIKEFTIWNSDDTSTTCEGWIWNSDKWPYHSLMGSNHNLSLTQLTLPCVCMFCEGKKKTFWNLFKELMLAQTQSSWMQMMISTKNERERTRIQPAMLQKTCRDSNGFLLMRGKCEKKKHTTYI